MKRLCLLVSMLSLLSCGGAKLHDLSLQRLDGSTFELQQVRQTPRTVFFFLSPECPLCENYSHTIDLLREQFAVDSVAFYGVFPGTFYDKASIQAFLSRYHPDVEVLLDPDYALTHHLGATVTPEAFLIDQQAEVLYSGCIDNWIPALGVKRSVVTEHYLRDALQARAAGQPVPITRQQPVGCFIE